MNDPGVPSREPASPARSEQRLPLDAIFAPRAVAVIGATEKPGSVGRAILRNLISNPFGGTVYPVNPHRPSVLGIRAYSRIADVPESVDLAVVVTPAPTVPDVVRKCVEAGVKGAIIISAGFKETGRDGAKLESQVLEAARQRTDAPDRAQLSGRDAPRAGTQRHLRYSDRPAGDCRLLEPEWRVMHRHPRLEPASQRRFQCVRLRRVDARCRLGRPH